MLWLLAIWICFFVLSLGIGLTTAATLRRIGGPTFCAPLTTFQVFWLGYCSLLLLLGVYSLVQPIRLPAVLLASTLAATGFYLGRKAVLGRLRSLRARPRRLAIVVLIAALTALVVASRAAQSVSWYDTHLYHLQVVQWARKLPAVPGIANLHYRLAYNNSVHLFAALTDVFWPGRASHIALGFLSSVLIVQLLLCAMRVSHRRARATAAFSLVMLPFILGRVWTSNELSSLSSDLALGLIGIVTILEIVQLNWRSAARLDLPLALVFALAASATTTKLGGLGLLAVAGMLVLSALLRFSWDARRAAGLVVLPVLALLAHLARQVVMSGWLWFPVPAGNLHLPWSLPDAQALEQYRWIQSWARIPKADPADVLDHGFLHWFAPWFERFQRSPELLVALAAVAVVFVRLVRRNEQREQAQLSAALAALLSIIVWFRGAPDLRFGAVFFWLLLAAVSAPVLGETLKRRSGQAVGLMSCLALSFWTGGLDLQLPNLRSWSRIPRVRARAAATAVELSPGLQVFMPGRAGDDRCSNEPIPCTPYEAPLLLRRPGDLASGFLYAHERGDAERR